MNREVVRADLAREKAWNQAVAIMRSEGYEISPQEEVSYRHQLTSSEHRSATSKVKRKEYR